MPLSGSPVACSPTGPGVSGPPSLLSPHIGNELKEERERANAVPVTRV